MRRSSPGRRPRPYCLREVRPDPAVGLVTRESAAAKARRILAEGRVTVTACGPGYARALVRGDGAVHEVTEDARGRLCTCQARGLCSHLLALGLVTAPRQP